MSTKETDRHSLRQYRIPEHMHAGIINYVFYGILPGEFLQAVLRNDLAEAVGRADWMNQEVLPNYVRWLYNEAPQGCWGSPEKVAAWIEARQEEQKAKLTDQLERSIEQRQCEENSKV